MQHDFPAEFTALAGHPPLPWQSRLFGTHFVRGDFPEACLIPSGLGKTSVVFVWLLALSYNPSVVPRRLVHVLNRRTIFDHATTEFERCRARLATHPGLAQLRERLRALCAQPSDPLLKVCTPRGAYGDCSDWTKDPTCPAAVAGTIDTVGSGLLFSRGGVNAAGQAGLLGHDVLVVHDDADLEPSFQNLAEEVRGMQLRGRPLRKFRVMALSAVGQARSGTFTLDAADSADPVVAARTGAPRSLHLLAVNEPSRLASAMASKALTFRESGRAVAVVSSTDEMVRQVAAAIRIAGSAVEQVSDTQRGYEAEIIFQRSARFARFVPETDRRCAADSGAVFLVCSDAAVVGSNLSADHLVCDLAPIDVMTHRLARVNRFAESPGAEVHVLHSTRVDKREFLGLSRERTLSALHSLDGDASGPAIARLGGTRFREASSPPPALVSATDVEVDTWALTTAFGQLPGRPPVAPYVRGRRVEDEPEAFLAWREEVAALALQYATSGERAARQPDGRRRLADFARSVFHHYPIKAHELLRDTAAWISKQVGILAQTRPFDPAWLVRADGTVTIHTLVDLSGDAGRGMLNGRTLVLPPAAGGLAAGRFVGAAPDVEGRDVADEYSAAEGVFPRERRRESGEPTAPPVGMRLVLEFDLTPDGGSVRGQPACHSAGDPPRRYYRWYVPVPPHAVWSGEQLALVGALFPNHPYLKRVLGVARSLHDLGQKRGVWQRLFGGGSVQGDGGGRVRCCPHARPTDYRYEFGSLLDAADDPAFQTLESAEEQDLVLHLITALHGLGRPHVPPKVAVDPERPSEAWARAAREVPRRFARLQRTYGHWALAYLEAVLRATVGSHAPATVGGPP